MKKEWNECWEEKEENEWMKTKEKKVLKEEMEEELEAKEGMKRKE